MSIRAKFLYKIFQVMHNRAYGSNPLENPMVYQEKLLLTELNQQAETEYGRKYGFAEIKSVEDFQRRVPLTMYEDYLPYYERIKRGSPNVLFRDKLLAWLLTSGVTSDPKMIPFTDRLEHKLGMAPITVYLSYIEENPRENLRCLSGKFLSVVADPEVERINGLPLGYGSGIAITLKARSKFAASMFTPSLDVLIEKDWDKKYWGISQQATKQNVSMIGGVPAYLANYLKTLDEEHKQKLGLADKSISEIWPNLKLIIWSGAELARYLTRLTHLLGENVDYREIYATTEAGVVTYQRGGESGVPILGNNFIEFIPLGEWRKMEDEGGNYQDFEFTCHTFQDVKPGIDYVIVFTTVGGMYRYVVGDTVIFHKSDIPRFTWSGRTAWYSNIAVERMNYGHIEKSVKILEETLGCPISNFSYATSDEDMNYKFIIESETPPPQEQAENLANLMDTCLMEANVEYQFCRERKLLQAPTVDLVDHGTYELLEVTGIQEKGTRIGQYKPPHYTDSHTLQLIKSVSAKRKENSQSESNK